MYVDKHHIIPKFLGGTDDESNLVKLPRRMHQEVHYRRWLVYGHIQDLYSAIFLGKNLSDEEMCMIYEDQKKRCLRDKEKLTAARLRSEKWLTFHKNPDYIEKKKKLSKQGNQDGKINSPKSRKLISEIKRSVPNYNSKQICVNGVTWEDSAKCVRSGGSDGLTLSQLRYRLKSPNYPNIYYTSGDEQH